MPKKIHMELTRSVQPNILAQFWCLRELLLCNFVKPPAITRVTNSSCFDRTFGILALNIPHPGKPFGTRQTREAARRRLYKSYFHN